MHCSHCASLMLELETEQRHDVEQSRYECPTCGRTQLTTKTVDRWKQQAIARMSRFGGRTLRQI